MDKPQKSPDAYRTISEVSDQLDVPQHVLRFWETKFPQIAPLKRAGNRRYYDPAHLRLLERVRDLLYVEGYTTKGVQKLLNEGRLMEGATQTSEAEQSKPTASLMDLAAQQATDSLDAAPLEREADNPAAVKPGLAKSEEAGEEGAAAPQPGAAPADQSGAAADPQARSTSDTPPDIASHPPFHSPADLQTGSQTTADSRAFTRLAQGVEESVDASASDSPAPSNEAGASAEGASAFVAQTLGQIQNRLQLRYDALKKVLEENHP